MKLLRYFVFWLPPLLIAVLWSAGAGAHPAQAAAGQPPAPGNYCQSCHQAEDERLLAATSWKGGREILGVDPCPASQKIQEELYYTERLMLAIDRGRAGLPGYLNLEGVDARIAANQESYARLLDEPVTSLEAFVAQAQSLRYGMGKTYTQINALDETAKRQRVLFFAGLATLAVVGSLVWGWRNARRALAARQAALPGSQPAPRSLHSPALILVAAILVFFALPIFRTPAQVVVATSAEEQARAAVLDTAARAADSADRSLARAWMLARVGAAWHSSDPQAGVQAFNEALAAAGQARQNQAALWGEAQAAQEAAAGGVTGPEKASLTTAELSALQGRAWGYRLAAEEWRKVDPWQAAAILEQALAAARAEAAPYRDLDLRAIAVTWAAIDYPKGLALLQEVQDPQLRAWGYLDIAQANGQAGLYARAEATANEVADPASRALAVARVAAVSGSLGSIPAAAQALDETGGAAQAYALASLAAASGDASLAESISPTYPSARALALLGLRRYEGAWAAAAQIADPYDQARAQAAIVAAWSKDTGSKMETDGILNAARGIRIPVIRQRALRDVIQNLGEATLVNELSIPYYRVQALTRLGQYSQAWEAAPQLKELYPLVELGIAWANSDPQAALQVADRLEQESGKAQVLLAVAATQSDPALFTRALDLALAARVRGDALSPAEASLALAKAVLSRDPGEAQTAFQQALSAAQQISIK